MMKSCNYSMSILVKFFFGLLLLFMLAGCDKKEKVPFDYPQHGEPQQLFHTPITAKLFESTSDVLPEWRIYGDVKPTLLLFSNKTLAPVPREFQDDVSTLLNSADPEEIRRRTARPFAPDTLLQVNMSVAAAMHEKYFSRVVWVVPVANDRELTLESFQLQLRERAEFWGEYIDTFSLKDGRITGQLDGVPVDVVKVDQLPELDGPVLMHFETGYIQPLYRDEIKTPVFSLLRQVCKAVAEKQYAAWMVSVSRDTLSDGLSLESRFVADEIARFLALPENLDKITEEEVLRRDALSLVNFFKYEDVFKSYHELANLRPDDASAWYGQYKALRDLRQPDNALTALERAVSLDPVYAYEYQDLSDLALQAKREDKALEMLDKVIAANPQDPFLRFHKARLLLSLGRNEEAEPILQELASLPWSTFYYPEIKTEIERLY